MAYAYEFLPDVALADIAYRVKADTLADLFRGAAEGLTRVLADAKGISADREQNILLEEDTLADALHSFLSELVYLKDAQSFLMHHADLAVDETPLVTVKGTLYGDMIDPTRQELGQDVKAITYHLFEAGRDDQGFYAQVVLDI